MAKWEITLGPMGKDTIVVKDGKRIEHEIESVNVHADVNGWATVTIAYPGQDVTVHGETAADA